MSHETNPTQPAAATDAARWFESEVFPHDGQLKAYLRGAYPAVRDVEDVVQESYLKVWRVRSAQPIESAKAFLFKVAGRLALNTVLRQRRSPEVECDISALPVADPAADAARAALTRDLIHHAIEALVALPARHRHVVMLHKLDGLSHQEIAAKLGLTERTAQKYCWQGIERCAARLNAKGIDGFFS